MRDTVGIVFDIEEFAVYDGPGIRMAVFLKGCPLRCEWCHNPEGLKPRAERTVTKSLCVNCGECMKACPLAAQGIEVGPPPRPRHCVVCGKCVAVCPRRAIQIAGTPMKASDVELVALFEPPSETNFGGGLLTGTQSACNAAASAFAEAVKAVAQRPREV